MIYRLFAIVFFGLVITNATAQKKNLQAAWRSLSDYEESQKDGKPAPEFLAKARQAVDEASVNEKTRNQTRTYAYRARVYYALYRQDLENALKETEDSTGDQNEKMMIAYGKADLANFETASAAFDSIRKNDQKYFDKIAEGIKSGTSSLDDEDMKLALVAQQMKLESGNIATGKYRAKQYEKAADYFYKTAVINSVLYNTKDTANFYNACVAASRAKDKERISTYNRAMIDAGVASPYNYESLYGLQIAK